MMKRIITYILLPLFLSGCSKHDEQPGPPEQPTGTTQVNFSLKVKDMNTRSGGEDISKKVNNIEVLAFEEIEGNYTYTYRATAQRTDMGDEYEYSVALRPTDVNVTLLVIANHTDFRELQVGFSIEKVMEVLLHPFTAEGINRIPMYGKINITGGVDSGTTIDPITLLRSVAAIEIILGDALHTGKNLLLKSIQAYRANDLIQIISESSSPSVPQSASNNITTLRVDAEGVTDTTPVRIYLPESEAPEPENITKEATCLIIGGIYRENNQDTNNTVTYYRVDFGKDTYIGQILRNHLYTIKITEVAGPGTTHPDEAVDKNISTIIYEWGESNHNIEL